MPFGSWERLEGALFGSQTVVADVEWSWARVELDWEWAGGMKTPFGSGQRLEGAFLGCQIVLVDAEQLVVWAESGVVGALERLLDSSRGVGGLSRDYQEVASGVERDVAQVDYGQGLLGDLERSSGSRKGVGDASLSFSRREGNDAENG